MKKSVFVLFVSACVLPILAAPINGNFDIRGSVQVSASTINFLPAGDATGDFTIDGTTSTITNNGVPILPELPPSSADADYTGSIRDIVGLPVNAPISFLNFITFDAFPQYSLELTQLVPPASAPGCAPPYSDSTCLAPPGFLILLSNTATGGVTAAFDARGRFYENGAYVADWNGTFTSQFQNTSISALFEQIANTGVSDATSYSASISVSSIPEPGSMSLAVAGFSLLALGLARRRK